MRHCEGHYNAVYLFREFDLHFTKLRQLPRSMYRRVILTRGSRSLTCSVLQLDPRKVKNDSTSGTRSDSKDHEQECWRAFDNSAQFSLIYLFHFRFGRMFNKDASESLKRITYLVVNNVIDTRFEYSVAQVRLFKLYSQTHVFLR